MAHDLEKLTKISDKLARRRRSQVTRFGQTGKSLEVCEVRGGGSRCRRCRRRILRLPTSRSGSSVTVVGSWKSETLPNLSECFHAFILWLFYQLNDLIIQHWMYLIIISRPTRCIWNNCKLRSLYNPQIAYHTPFTKAEDTRCREKQEASSSVVHGDYIVLSRAKN